MKANTYRYVQTLNDTKRKLFIKYYSITLNFRLDSPVKFLLTFPLFLLKQLFARAKGMCINV